MKLLVFHPHHDALQETAQALAENGTALLFATTMEDARGLLEIHASSLDGVWVHTDGALPGLEFLASVRSNPATAEIAALVSTESWSDAQCAEHQASPQGANAYLRWPATTADVQKILSEIFPAEVVPAQVTDAGFSLEIPLSSGGTSLEIAGHTQEAPAFAPPSHVQVADLPPAEIPIELTSEAPTPESDNPNNQEAEAALPYLFRKKVQTDSEAVPTARNAPIAWGDAVIPGGAAQTPDEETLKKYLMLREQDVAALSSQLRAARTQIHSLEQTVAESQAIQSELKHLIEEAQKRIGQFENEKSQALAQQESQIQELKFESKSKQDRLQKLEGQVREASSEVEQIKERVRQDIRKIRVREKELENRLEIVRRDSEALLTAREAKIIELKRRLDLLEFNMDLLQDQYNRSKDQNKKLEEKLNRAAQVVRVAGGMLVEEKSA